MIDQEAEDEAARIKHIITQRGHAARSWQRQAEQHETTIQAMREDVARAAAKNDELQRQLAEAHQQLTIVEELARVVLDSAARELNYSPDVLLVSSVALRELARCVSPDQSVPERAQSEETRGG